jgi:hypothetical protein
MHMVSDGCTLGLEGLLHQFMTTIINVFFSIDLVYSSKHVVTDEPPFIFDRWILNLWLCNGHWLVNQILEMFVQMVVFTDFWQMVSVY